MMLSWHNPVFLTMWCLHIFFDLPIWCLHIFWLDYVMFLMTWKMGTRPFENRTLYFNYFCYVVLFCFSEAYYIYKGWNISLLHRKGQSFIVTRSPFSPLWYFQTLSSSCFCFLILAYLRLGASNFVLLSLMLLPSQKS